MPLGKAMAEPITGIYSTADSHESRIQRLETLAIENSAAIAEQGTKIEAIGEHMVSSIENVADKIDMFATSMNSQISDLSNKVQKLDSKIHSSDNRINSLEQDKRSSDKFRKIIGKVLTGMFVAGGGSLATYIVEHFLLKH